MLPSCSFLIAACSVTAGKGTFAEIVALCSFSPAHSPQRKIWYSTPLLGETKVQHISGDPLSSVTRGLKQETSHLQGIDGCDTVRQNRPAQPKH